MLRYYLAVALRNLARTKIYAAISIGGLGTGFAAVVLIALYVRDELAYDRWIPDHERIYQISAMSPGPDGRAYGVVPSDVGQWLRLDFPELEAVTRLFRASAFLKHEDREFPELVFWADASVFDVFRFPVAAGSLAGALEQPDGLVITRELALKYFDRHDPIGEILLLDGQHAMRVTAVIEDLPSSTHLDIDVLAAGHAEHSPAAEQDRNPLQRFGGKLWNSLTYFLLEPGADIEAVRRRIPEMLNRRTPEHDGRVGENYPLLIRAVAELHLSPGTLEGSGRDFGRLYAVAAIGALILLAASINFVNLLTALGVRRAVEVGVRKTAGATRRDLIVQFMSEAALYVIAAAAVGMALAAALLGALNAFLLREMRLASLADPGMAAGVLAFLALTALLAGVYPSWVLSAFRPAIVMKARAMSGGMAIVRQTLVVLQFSILIGLLIATVVIERQMRFGMAEALRRNDTPILTIQTGCSDAFKSRIVALPGVESAACAWQLPQLGIGPGSAVRRADGEGSAVRYTSIDAGFFELFGLQPRAGRFFSTDLADAAPPDNIWNRPEALILNQTAVRQLGFASAEDAVGEIVQFNRVFRLPATFTGFHDAEIIGVVDDFQTGPVSAAIVPAAFYMHPQQSTVMALKLRGEALPETLAAIDGVWEEFGEPGPVRRVFFEQMVQTMYLDVRRQTQLFSAFSGLAVLIGLLGLVGLAADAAAKRTKEIGIRKVLGGKRAAIVRLLLAQFSKPVLLANVVAWPLAYYFMSAWLAGFARRIDLEAWMFAAAAGVALALALATVAVHTYAMAGIRPVIALRYE